MNIQLGGWIREGLRQNRFKPSSKKFHKNFIFYKIFVDMLNGFDMGSAEGGGTHFTPKDGA
jgi:hypothetical protein